MSNRFAEFVEQQVLTSSDEGGALSLDDEKSMWIAKLDELYALVQDSLSEYLANGRMQIEFSEMAINEEQLGQYTVREARIHIGRQLVRLEPLGTFLIGARGRVDMTGARGIARLVVVPPNARAPNVRVTVSVIGQTSQPFPPVEPPQPPATWIWKIATPPPRVAYINLTKESFREALMGVVNG